MNHSHNYFEINPSIGCTSFISTPAISPANYSFGSLDYSLEEKELPGIEKKSLLFLSTKLYKTLGLWVYVGIAVVFGSKIHLS